MSRQNSNIKVELSQFPFDVDVKLRLLRLSGHDGIDECKSLARRLVREHLRPLGEKLRIEIMNLGPAGEKLLLSEPCAFQVHLSYCQWGLLDADVLDMPGRSEMIWLDAWDIANKLLADYAHEYASAQAEVERQLSALCGCEGVVIAANEDCISIQCKHYPDHWPNPSQLVEMASRN